MNKKSVLKKLAMLLSAALVLSSFPAVVFAEENSGITLKNNEMSADVSSAFGGSLLVAGTINITEGTKVYVKLFDESGAEMANVPVEDALAAGEDKDIQLLVHKNRAKYKLYQSGVFVKEGAIQNGIGKTAAKVSVIAEGGEALMKNLKVSDYMNTSDKTKTLFESDFSNMGRTRVGTMKAFDGYCDDWYAEKPYEGTENGAWDYFTENGERKYYASVIDGADTDLYLRYMDQTGTQSLRHMIKNGGEDKNFEISTKIFFSRWDYKYNDGFKMFITDYEDESVLDLIKGGAMSSDYKIKFSDCRGNELFTLPAQKWVDVKIKVDLDAQMYVVSYSYNSGGIITETSAPIPLPNITADVPYAVNAVGSVGYAKTAGSQSGSFYAKNISVKEDADASVEMLFEADFNDGSTDGWGLLVNNVYSPLGYAVKTFEGHKALYVERASAVNIKDVSDKTDGVTHFGTLNADGTFTQASNAKGGNGPSRRQAVYITLDKPIKTADNIFVEYDLHMGNKSWRYNAATESYSPRDAAYVTLGTDLVDTADYMEFVYDNSSIMFSKLTAAGEKIIPKIDGKTFNWKENGPVAEWVTSRINNNGGKNILFETNGKMADKKSFVSDVSGVAETVDKLGFSVNYYNGGAVYIDNIKIYTKDESVKETVDFAAQTTSEIPVTFEEREKSLTINEIEGLSYCKPIDSVTVNNYSGEVGQNVYVIAALYKKTGADKMLVECAAEKTVLSKVGENVIEFSSSYVLPKEYTAEEYDLILFMFDSENLKPLVGAVRCTAAE